MKNKTPVEQLRDTVAEILTELLDLAEPLCMDCINCLNISIHSKRDALA